LATTGGLLAQVLVAKYADHLPLYRQESIFARAGMALSRSTLAEWVGACGVQLQPLVDALKYEMLRHSVLHADETPVAMMAPGKKKTHRAYLWAYCPGAFEDLKAVVYDFAPSRAREHARAFLQQDNQPWRGKLVCDDFSGYKASFAQGVMEAGCAAHAQRKFFELHANTQSAVAEQALRFFGELAEIEREARTLDTHQRLRLRQERTRPLADSLHAWMLAQRLRATDRTSLAGTGLEPQAMGCAHMLHRRRAAADRQQPGREPDSANRTRACELAVRRLTARGSTRRSGDEPEPVGQAQRARPARVTEGRAAALADAQSSPRRRTSAPSMEVRKVALALHS
jgi:hypothetical protein